MVPMDPAVSPDDATAGFDEPLDWGVIARGAFVGLAIIVPVTVVRVILDREIRDFDDSGWVYPLFVLILVAYFTAGWVAGRARTDTPLMHGTLAGFGVLVLWLPIRVIIWALREDDKGLFSGDKAVLRPGQVFGAFLIAAAIAMLGGFVGAKVVERTRAHD
jgi:hypothetical protein